MENQELHYQNIVIRLVENLLEVFGENEQFWLSTNLGYRMMKNAQGDEFFLIRSNCYLLVYKRGSNGIWAVEKTFSSTVDNMSDACREARKMYYAIYNYIYN